MTYRSQEGCGLREFHLHETPHPNVLSIHCFGIA